MTGVPQGRLEHDRMKALWHGQVIAESDQTLEVDGYRYFPRESVRMDLPQVVPKTQSDLACPHGVQFYDLAADTARTEPPALSSDAPRGSTTKVDHSIPSWNAVEMQWTPGVVFAQ